MERPVYASNFSCGEAIGRDRNVGLQHTWTLIIVQATVDHLVGRLCQT
jgi:hypothetical protein